ncbi:DUF6252 family protein [Dyadobacter pollutisoli]|jgi:hypothetical protein|uniref:DUF6252 family protein n=1 Tax=Dyadobacter pollutisoli TaxID=2910158 RepID=A0A9E8N8T3_9BACT|nr:DUF6252 family protein [Dyadobacter pollutisoli]WAC10611.1 DUF6252 family protein [Dyadobacter pollutisoli]
MKTLQIAVLFAIIGLVTFSSCSKKSDDVTPDPAATVGFQVKVDGKTYAPDYAYALASFPGANGYYAVYGLDSKTSDVVAIALPNSAVEGTYPINAVNFGILTLNKEDFSTINGGDGKVTITKKTATQLQGTFSFTAFDAAGKVKRTLTEGSFNVNIR